MSELAVGSLKGLAANSFVIDVASGSSLDLSAGAVLPAGSILQVVQTVKTDVFSSTSTSLTDVTGLSVTITPTSATSKIFVSVVVPHGISTQDQVILFTLTDGSNNNLVAASSPSSRTPAFEGAFPNVADMRSAVFNLLHEPATTSAFTYKVRASISSSARTFYVNRAGTDTDESIRSRGVATITAMEVAG